MVHKPGIKRIALPVSVDHWRFLRQLAAERRTSIAGELATLATPAIETARRRLAGRLVPSHGSDRDGSD